MKKRILSLILASAILLSLAPYSVSAENGTKYDKYLYYTINDDGETVTISDCDPEADYVAIPEKINGRTVTSIGDSAFWACYELTSVEIPNSVISIGQSAFEDCYKLTSVNIPNGVTSISYGAFYSCYSLANIEIPNSVTEIGEFAFHDCGFTDVTIPDSVKTIGDSAFSACSKLETVNIGSGTDSIGDTSFTSNQSLTSINVSGQNQSYCSVDGNLFDKSMETLICYAVGKPETSYSIPYGVKKIGGYAFHSGNFGNKLTSITIPNSVTSIGDRAFFYCSSLPEIEIPNSVTEIAEYAFADCTNLKSIEIPSSITRINNGTFYDCNSLTDVKIPSSVTEIGAGAFAACGFSSITLPNSIKEINASTFSSCIYLTDINMPDIVTTIGYSAFAGCKSLENIDFLPDSVTSIGEGAFSYCGLTSVTLPDNITEIAKETFKSCEKLTDATIPDGVKYIGYSAFSGCKMLSKVKIPSSVTSIGMYAFENCGFVKIKIPEGVEKIDDGAFQNCGIIEIKIPDSVTSIGSNVFANCKKLIFATLSDNITEISASMFSNCEKLASIVIPEKVMKINSYAFYNCKNLKNIIIPNNVTSIGASAFYGCEKLTGIEIPEGVTKIEDSTFYGCTNLEKAIMYGDITSIGFNVFNYCEKIGSITLPKSVTRIGNNSFVGCDNLSNIYFCGTETDWNEIPNKPNFKDVKIHFECKKPTPPPELILPSDINDITIIGKGTAYGRFKVKYTNNVLARNQIVDYSIDGGNKKSGATDSDGYLLVEINDIQKSHNYSISISGDKIKPTTETMSVTVKPLEYTYEMSGSASAGSEGTLILGYEKKLGKFEFGARLAQLGVGGSREKAMTCTIKQTDGKTKLSLSATENLDAALRATIGLWGEASLGENASIQICPVQASANATAGNLYTVTYEDDDFNINDTKDLGDVALNLLCFSLECMNTTPTPNIITDQLGKLLISFHADSRETGWMLSKKAGLERGRIQFKDEHGNTFYVSVSNKGTNVVYSSSVKENKDKTIDRNYSITTVRNANLFDVGAFVNINGENTNNSNTEGSDKPKQTNTLNVGSTAYAIKSNNNTQLSAKSDENNNVSSLGISFTDNSVAAELDGLEGSFTDILNISYSGDAIDKVAELDPNLSDFVNNKQPFFIDAIEMASVARAMGKSNIKGMFAHSKKYTKELSGSVSESNIFCDMFKYGFNLNFSGIESVDYKKHSGIYYNNTQYIQAENDLDEQMDNMFGLSIGNIIEKAQSYISQRLDKCFDTSSGYLDNPLDIFIDNGKAMVKKAGDTLSGWKVSISRLVNNENALSILAVEDDYSLFSPSSLATTVGSPYIVYVEDENEKTVDDLSSNPLMLTLKYTDDELAAAGVTDANEIAIYRWSDEKCVYVRMGGTLNEADKSVSLQIDEPGQYVLAVDNQSPAVTDFKALSVDSAPILTATISDMSGIADFELQIDGRTVVDNDNLSDYYSYNIGEFRYQTNGLSSGTHQAVIYATDTAGNSLTDGAALEFTVDTDAPIISNVTQLPSQCSGELSVSATVTGENVSSVYLNVEEVDAAGNSILNTYEMTEENGTYTASSDNFAEGNTLNVWVEAYNKNGNLSQSEKQSVLCASDEPLLVFKKVDRESAVVELVNFYSFVDGRIILAVYDKKGTLTDVITKDCDQTVTFDNLDLNNCVVKAMFFDGSDSVKPLAKAARFVV